MGRLIFKDVVDCSSPENHYGKFIVDSDDPFELSLDVLGSSDGVCQEQLVLAADNDFDLQAGPMMEDNMELPSLCIADNDFHPEPLDDDVVIKLDRSTPRRDGDSGPDRGQDRMQLFPNQNTVNFPASSPAAINDGIKVDPAARLGTTQPSSTFSYSTLQSPLLPLINDGSTVSSPSSVDWDHCSTFSDSGISESESGSGWRSSSVRPSASSHSPGQPSLVTLGSKFATMQPAKEVFWLPSMIVQRSPGNGQISSVKDSAEVQMVTLPKVKKAVTSQPSLAQQQQPMQVALAEPKQEKVLIPKVQELRGYYQILKQQPSSPIITPANQGRREPEEAASTVSIASTLSLEPLQSSPAFIHIRKTPGTSLTVSNTSLDQIQDQMQLFPASSPVARNDLIKEDPTVRSGTLQLSPTFSSSTLQSPQLRMIVDPFSVPSPSSVDCDHCSTSSDSGISESEPASGCSSSSPRPSASPDSPGQSSVTFGSTFDTKQPANEVVWLPPTTMTLQSSPESLQIASYQDCTGVKMVTLPKVLNTISLRPSLAQQQQPVQFALAEPKQDKVPIPKVRKPQGQVQIMKQQPSSSIVSPANQEKRGPEVAGGRVSVVSTGSLEPLQSSPTFIHVRKTAGTSSAVGGAQKPAAKSQETRKIFSAILKEHRRIRNRESACLSRQKHKEYISSIKEELKEAHKTIEELRRENRVLKSRLENILGGEETGTTRTSLEWVMSTETSSSSALSGVQPSLADLGDGESGIPIELQDGHLDQVIDQILNQVPEPSPRTRHASIFFVFLMVFALNATMMNIRHWGPVAPRGQSLDESKLPDQRSKNLEYGPFGSKGPFGRIDHPAGRSILWGSDNGSQPDPEVWPSSLCKQMPYVNATESMRLESQLRGWFQLDNKTVLAADLDAAAKFGLFEGTLLPRQQQPLSSSLMSDRRPKKILGGSSGQGTLKPETATAETELASNGSATSPSRLLDSGRNSISRREARKMGFQGHPTRLERRDSVSRAYRMLMMMPPPVDDDDDDFVTLNRFRSHNRRGLSLFRSKVPRFTYESFFEAIERRDDTFYVVTFSGDHLLLPARSRDNSSLPRMSLLLPSVTVNMNDSMRPPENHVTMMQIDCEVTNTKLLHIREDAIPSQQQHQGGSGSDPKRDTSTTSGGRLKAPDGMEPLILTRPRNPWLANVTWAHNLTSGSGRAPQIRPSSPVQSENGSSSSSGGQRTNESTSEDPMVDPSSSKYFLGMDLNNEARPKWRQKDTSDEPASPEQLAERLLINRLSQP